MSEREDRDGVNRAVDEKISVLTVQEVAALLKVKPSWVYDKVAAGEFPVIRLGRQLRFRSSDIRAYLEASYEPATRLHPARPSTHGAQVRRVGRPRRR